MTSRTLRYLVAALGIGVLFLVCCTHADARSRFRRSRPAPPYSFEVEDESGNSLPTFVKDGQPFLLGEQGLRYNVRVLNPTGQRVEAVVSVDGRDALSGQPGDYVHQRGYVIPAYGSVLVEGFRTSWEEVAAFRFTSPDDSYSARRGTPQNVGVIGVAFFPERVPPAEPVMRRPRSRPVPPPYAPEREDRHREGAGEADSERGASAQNNLGTQFGEARESVVSSIAFERALPTHPALVARLRYDDADGLAARGIDLSPVAYSRPVEDEPEPEPFPVSRFSAPPPR